MESSDELELADVSRVLSETLNYNVLLLKLEGPFLHFLFPESDACEIKKILLLSCSPCFFKKMGNLGLFLFLVFFKQTFQFLNKLR